MLILIQNSFDCIDEFRIKFNSCQLGGCDFKEFFESVFLGFVKFYQVLKWHETCKESVQVIEKRLQVHKCEVFFYTDVFSYSDRKKTEKLVFNHKYFAPLLQQKALHACV